MGSGRSLRASLVSPFVSQRLCAFISKPNRDDLIALTDLIESGEVTPVIDKTYKLGETPDAIGYVGERHTQGKTVVTT